ncbi:hypothetical protein CC80DRAFT_552573 [Byssothecium circinans]|uniref:Uncharacterized protein n=1 Tax=Byssothecium circinans TaxID=147558 RepID=A0A6A5TJ10_9PLEO|nr:hypothetical protein CC80DRAFT_552573 [Byssothecium circinans]
MKNLRSNSPNKGPLQVPIISLTALHAQASFETDGPDGIEYGKLADFLAREARNQSKVLCAYRQPTFFATLDEATKAMLSANFEADVSAINDPLDNGIFNLFYKGRFERTEGLDVAFMPALRLASRMMQCHPAYAWFTHMADEMARVSSLLVNGVTFSLRTDLHNSWGRSRTCPYSRVSNIQINADFVDLLEFLPPTSSKYYLVMYRLAKTIVHEVAHAFSAFSNTSRAYIPGGQEPRFSKDEDFAEMGRSFELAIDGASYTLPFFEHSGLGYFLSPRVGESFEHSSNPRVQYRMSTPTPEWLRMWFSKNTWKRIDREGTAFMQAKAKEVGLYNVSDCPTIGMGMRLHELLVDSDSDDSGILQNVEEW